MRINSFQNTYCGVQNNKNSQSNASMQRKIALSFSSHKSKAIPEVIKEIPIDTQLPTLFDNNCAFILYGPEVLVRKSLDMMVELGQKIKAFILPINEEDAKLEIMKLMIGTGNEADRLSQIETMSNTGDEEEVAKKLNDMFNEISESQKFQPAEDLIDYITSNIYPGNYQKYKH